jgi:hypothetical protein
MFSQNPRSRTTSQSLRCQSKPGQSSLITEAIRLAEDLYFNDIGALVQEVLNGFQPDPTFLLNGTAISQKCDNWPRCHYFSISNTANTLSNMIVTARKHLV